MTTDQMIADLTLRGWEPTTHGALGLACKEGWADLQGEYRYRLVFMDKWEWDYRLSKFTAVASVNPRVVWNQRMEFAGGTMIFDWNSEEMLKRVDVLPTLYQFLQELSQCTHESARSPDGKPRASAMRCTACGVFTF